MKICTHIKQLSKNYSTRYKPKAYSCAFGENTYSYPNCHFPPNSNSKALTHRIHKLHYRRDSIAQNTAGNLRFFKRNTIAVGCSSLDSVGLAREASSPAKPSMTECWLRSRNPGPRWNLANSRLCVIGMKAAERRRWNGRVVLRNSRFGDESSGVFMEFRRVRRVNEGRWGKVPVSAWGNGSSWFGVMGHTENKFMKFDLEFGFLVDYKISSKKMFM